MHLRLSFSTTRKALATESDLPAQIGHLGHIEAARLDVKAITLLAVRPDGYIGLRSGKNHLRELERYQSLILDGPRETAPITENFALPGISESS